MIQQKMLFTNQQEMIYPFLQQVAAFIEQHLPAQAGQLQFKVKVIITELLTNSIKHSGDAPTEVELIVAADKLVITKTDYGDAFNLKDEPITWPLKAIHTNPIKIYADKLNGVFADVVSPYSLSFYTESYVNDDETFAEMYEHYGLMIICRASDAFVYTYHPQSKKNVFAVTINFN
jgi:hypothetical protein